MTNTISPTISRILVPVDFSACSDHALRYATTLASRLDAHLEILHVIEEPFQSGAWSSEVYVSYIPELLTNLQAEADRRLGEFKAAASIPADTTVVIGRPSQAIADRAMESHADLIVMGTHGRTGVSHFVLGSVAERVLRKAPCAVLIVREPVAGKRAARTEAA